MTCTLDASVFVAAAREIEQHYAVSRQFLRQARLQTVELVCPTLILPECSAAIARPTNDAALAEEITALIESYAGLVLVALEPALARRAAQIARTHRLRGADSVYVAVAEMFDATLVTWDHEMLQRTHAAVSTMTPDQWLARYSTFD